jgi:hypothetical protein
MIQSEKNVFSAHYDELLEKVENLSLLSDNDLKQLLDSAKMMKTEYENLQLVVKRNANSLYGVSASPYFSLFDVDIAEDITGTARHFAILVDREINKFFQFWNNPENLLIMREFSDNIIGLKNFSEYVPDTKNDLCIYGDTDSRYILVEKLWNLLEFDEQPNIWEDDKLLISFVNFMVSKFINNIIKICIESDCEFRNAHLGYLSMAHEITTKKSIFLKKKKYVMTSIWVDGKTLSEPKIKYKGVEIKKGSMSEKAKKLLQKLLENHLLKDYDIPRLRKECLAIMNLIKVKKQKDYIYLVSSVSYSNLDINFDDKTKIYSSNKNHIQMQILVSWLNYIQENNMKNELKPAFNGQKMNYYYCIDPKYKVIGVPDDVDLNDLTNLPEPDWNKMLQAVLIKPLLRYIYEKETITDNDCDLFLLGIKQLSILNN